MDLFGVKPAGLVSALMGEQALAVERLVTFISATVGVEVPIAGGAAVRALDSTVQLLFVLGFVGAAIVFSFKPRDPAVHAIVGGAMVTFWAYRTIGFVQVVASGERLDLIGVAAVHSLLAVMTLVWHRRATRAIAVPLVDPSP